MKRNLLAFMMFLFVCVSASAESSSVWKAQKGDSVIYLGGTCHILRKSDYPFPPEFNKAYQASDVIVFETDIDKLLSPSIQQSLMTKAIYSDGTTIDKHLSEQTYNALSAYCEKNNIPLEMFKKFKPSILMTILTVMELSKLGINQEGVDLFFHKSAKEDKKTIESLETIEEQINYLISMADGIENEYVMHSLDDIKNIKEKFEIIAQAWRTGDIEKIGALMYSGIQVKLPELYKKLITERNQKWIPLIDAYMKSSNTEFILVGVAHMGGPDGIIALLKNKDYVIEKLKIKE